MACSSSTSNSSFEGLERSAESYFEAASNSKFVDMYDFYPAEFKEVCSPGDYSAVMRTTFKQAAKAGGIDGINDLSWEITDLQVEGTDGMVRVEPFYKGDVFNPSDQEDPSFMVEWTFIDGKWRFTDYINSENCD